MPDLVSYLVGGGALGAVLAFILKWRSGSTKISDDLFDRISSQLDASKKAEEECKQREDGYRDALAKASKAVAQSNAMLSQARVGTVIADAEERIIDVDTKILAMFHYRREELIGKNVQILVAPDFRDRHRKAMTDFIARGKAPRERTISSFGVRSNGEVFPVEIGIVDAFRDSEGRMTLTGTIREMSDSFR